MPPVGDAVPPPVAVASADALVVAVDDEVDVVSLPQATSKVHTKAKPVSPMARDLGVESRVGIGPGVVIIGSFHRRQLTTPSTHAVLQDRIVLSG